MGKKMFAVFAVLSGAGLVVGSWGVLERLLHGLYPVAFGSYIPWGLWVAFYLFFLGLSAGAFLITSLAYVFELKRFEALARLSAFTVLVTLLCEVLFIVLDLGRMERFYQFVVTPSPTSLMFWMFVLFLAMLVVYALKTFFLIRGDLIAWSNDPARCGRGFYRFLARGRSDYDQEARRSDQRRVHALSLISLPVGLLFYGVNGLFFAILMNRPVWNSALTPLLFIVAALLSGGALVTFLARVFQHDRELVRYLGQAVMYLLILFLFLEGLQFAVGYQTGHRTITTSLDHIVAGQYWWSFWAGHLLLGGLIPLVLLAGRGRSSGAVAWACALIVVTFITVRFNFIVPDQAVYKLEGLETAFFHARLSTSYLPNLNEWLVSLWVVSLGVLVFLIGTRFLPVVSSSEEVEHA